MKNVLITCAGRRNYLIEYFKNALEGKGFVLAADASHDAAALQEADRAFVVPEVKNPIYVKKIFEISNNNNVNLIISLNDLELPILSREIKLFKSSGIIPAISEPSVIDICFDKMKTAKILLEIGLKGPKTFIGLEEAEEEIRKGNIDFPFVIKPRWGTGSIGLEYARNIKELNIAYELIRKRLESSILSEISATDTMHSVIMQEYLDGQEYGLDVVCDLEGQYVKTFVKRKISMRAGETDKAETVDRPDIEAVGERIARELRHVGNLDCDVFDTPNGLYVLEMNPRFGGGYPFSHVAGANIPAALLAWANGKIPSPEWLKVRPGVRSAKCDRLVVCSEK